MKKHYLLCTFLLCLLAGLPFFSWAQKPDLSRFKTREEKVQTWLSYCERLKSTSNFGMPGSQQSLGDAASEGLALAAENDLEDKARFLAYKAQGFYYSEKMQGDSVEFYYLQSLAIARKINAIPVIVSDCVALMHIGFENERIDKVTPFRELLQSIIDTTANKQVLQEGYAALGNYYQQKAYYSTAQDYFIKSIVLKKQQADTTHINKIKNDYANQCYSLARLYLSTGSPDKAEEILLQGKQFAAENALTHVRYAALFIESFCKQAKIGAALAYLHKDIDPIDMQFKNSATTPAEVIFSNLAIAEYYIDRKQYDSAAAYLNKGYLLSGKGGEPLFIYKGQKLMARFCLETGNAAKAIPLLNAALPAALHFNKEDYADMLKYLARAQTVMGNKDSALQYYSIYISLLDTLTKEKISRNFADQEIHYQTSLKEKTISSLDKENKLKKLELETAYRTKLLLITGLVAFGIIALLLFFIYRNKEKINSLLHRQNTQLEQLNTDLGIANNTKAKLFSIISHDLRSPISQIIRLLQLQKENPGLLNAEAKMSHDARLKAASENVLETMEDMLVWSKSQMEHFKPHISPVNIYNIVKAAAVFLNSEAEQKNISIHIKMDETFSQKTDENFVTVIIRNLLQNAIKYSNAGSELLVSAENKRIFFINTSAAADAALLNDQLHNKNINSNKSGLGLQIVSDLAAAIGINILFQKNDADTLSAMMEWKS